MSTVRVGRQKALNVNAITRYRQAVQAIKAGDNTTGRKLLVESLREDTSNEMAWVWMARITSNPAKKRDYINRALAINERNPHALELLDELDNEIIIDENAVIPQPTTSQIKQIEKHIKKGDILARQNDNEAAVDEYVAALEIQVDHEDAMRKAVRQLIKQGYWDEAEALINDAIHAGSKSAAIYLTAIDFAEQAGQDKRVDALLKKAASLPRMNTKRISQILDQRIAEGRLDFAHAIAQQVAEANPKSQQIIIKLAQIHEEMGDEAESIKFYEKAAQLGRGTQAGQIADEKLQAFIPVLTDKERGHLVLAWREVLGVGLFYFLLAWQDAGLDLFGLGLRRWMGVLMAIAGGYLLISATSSPQQQPIASWLGGTVPGQRERRDEDGNVIVEKTHIPIIPMAVRVPLGIIGVGMLIFSFFLVFSAAIVLIQNPVEPYMPPFNF